MHTTYVDSVHYIQTNRPVLVRHGLKTETGGGGQVKAVMGSSLGSEKALTGAAFLNGDGQEVAGHVRHQDFLHAAETRPPGHLLQVHVQCAGGRLVQQW